MPSSGLGNSARAAESYNRLGAVLLKQGNFDQAVTTIQEALRLQPDIAEYNFNLGKRSIFSRDLMRRSLTIAVPWS